MFGRLMRAREIAHTKRDDNRVVRPFAWGAEFIREHANGDDPHIVFGEHTERVMARSEDFYALPEISDWQLAGDRLAWTLRYPLRRPPRAVLGALMPHVAWRAPTLVVAGSRNLTPTPWLSWAATAAHVFLLATVTRIVP